MEVFMRFKTIAGILIVLALAGFSVAQTKISGTVNCSKPDQFQKIDIGDKPGHAYAISQGKCTWTKPMDIAGIQTHDDVGTDFNELTNSGARGRGYVLGTMSNGDKFVVSTKGMDTYKDGKPQSTEGTWSFASGTGKIKGITGKGTYKGKPDSDGNMLIDVEGEYQLPK
jgi:hypothetical protein